MLRQLIVAALVCAFVIAGTATAADNNADNNTAATNNNTNNNNAANNNNNANNDNNASSAEKIECHDARSPIFSETNRLMADAMLHMLNNQLPDSSDELARALELCPTHPRVWFEYADNLMER
jgi:hypothetical protein